MKVRLKPETEIRLKEFASRSGRSIDDLLEDAVAGHLAELSEFREMVERRYDDVRSGRVKPINGEKFFENLRHRGSNSKGRSSNKKRAARIG
jgi:predicted DNA-binding protein